MTEPLLRVEELCKFFPVTEGVLGKVVGQVRAVDRVSFDLKPGETLGLVGESGCGKTTTGRSLLRLIEPTSGRVTFDGVDVTALRGEELRLQRRRMQIVFQDPYGSLNPRLRVVDLIGEGIERHGIARGAAVEPMVRDLLHKVGLPSSWTNRYPHEFSGGQRQRIGVARAIALEPDLVVCDEAVSALDVSIQAQVVNLLIGLRRELSLAYLFIAHDLSVVRHISDRVAVMYLGRIVELAPTEELFTSPMHPYTQALLSAIPIPDPKRKRERVVLHGDVPTPLSPPSGCHFHTRCPYAIERCSAEEPALVQLSARRTSRCVHAEGLEGAADAWQVLQDRWSRAQSSETRSARPIVLPRFHPGAGRERPGSAVTTRSPTGASHLHKPAQDEVSQSLRGKAQGSSARWPLLVGLAACCLLWIAGMYGWGLLVIVCAAPLVGMGYAPLPTARQAFAGMLVLLACWGASVPLGRARRQADARAHLQGVAEAVRAYAENTGELPPSLGSVQWRLWERFPGEASRDPWGSAVQYQSSGSGAFQLRSLGPDKQRSSDDLLLEGALR